MMMCDNLQNSAATNIKTIYQTHINKMWDLIMELYEYFFLPEIYTRVLPPTEHSFFYENPRELV